MSDCLRPWTAMVGGSRQIRGQVFQPGRGLRTSRPVDTKRPTCTFGGLDVAHKVSCADCGYRLPPVYMAPGMSSPAGRFPCPGCGSQVRSVEVHARGSMPPGVARGNVIIMSNLNPTGHVVRPTGVSSSEAVGSPT